jgi:DivIVA domain-containing protein
MNPESIEEIRSAAFTLVRKGYDPGEVRRYLSELADRLQGEQPGHPGSEVVRRELELVGAKTADILVQAEESAERMHAESVREAGGVLAKAREDSEAARRAADEHAARVRAEADTYAEATRAGADRESVTQFESELEELKARREEILADLTDLAGELKHTLAERAEGNGPLLAEPVPDAAESAPAPLQP